MLHLIPVLLLAANPPLHPVNDTLSPIPAHLHHGFLAPRVEANTRRLLAVDLEPLLDGYRVKPGTHPWIGEHIGKWMHAATLAWEYESDPDTRTKLRERLRYAAAELIKAQEPDGYLGTYTPDTRFGLFEGADWDVWSHKYCLIGLLASHRATGDAAALDAARRAADLLINTFGPGKKSIITAGTHVGMAATSVIDPFVILHRATGEQKYLDFALHIVDSYNDPNGPRLLESLLSHASVARTANGKAYEMLSNCVGLCELYRATGDARFLDAARNAFDDVVANHLYITGTASHGEHFREGHSLPNATSHNVGETCVTVTWIQLCEQLFRLTGGQKYANEIERSIYNHLAAAQHPERGDWCYYTSLDGPKPYTAHTCCCLSSGPRAMAMIPALVFMKESGGGGGDDRADTLVVHLLESAEATVRLAGADVRVSLDSSLPPTGTAALTISHDAPAPGVRFGLRIRTAEWAEPLTTPGTPSIRDADGWCAVEPREWKSGDRVEISFHTSPRIISGTFGNAGKAAVARGPFVMALDAAANPGVPPARLLWLTGEMETGPGAPALSLRARAIAAPDGRPVTVTLLPFADAGADGGHCTIWLGAPASFSRAAHLATRELAAESRSRAGNVPGSILDDNPASFVVTFDNTPAAEDWYAIEFASPVEFTRVRFVHGRTFHDGGWFDTSARPPRVETRATPDAPWQHLADLTAYPKTTRTDPGALRGGEPFELNLPRAIRAAAVRVIGTPSHGSNPRQAFSSCAELWVGATEGVRK